MSKKIIGFSKLSKQEKIEWICSNYLDDYQADIEILEKYLNTDINIQHYLLRIPTWQYQSY